MQSSRRSPIHWMLWQWWLCLTAIYAILDGIEFLRHEQLGVASPIKGAFGLFVPIGFISAVFGPLANRLWPEFFVVALAFAIVMDRVIRKSRISGRWLVAACLATLFVATFILDLSWYFTSKDKCFWPSWQIFVGHLTCGRW